MSSGPQDKILTVTSTSSFKFLTHGLKLGAVPATCEFCNQRDSF